jgi:hypothetical protein
MPQRRHFASWAGVGFQSGFCGWLIARMIRQTALADKLDRAVAPM